MDFDIRGLSVESRHAFWAGVEAANLRFATWDQLSSFSAAVGAIRLLHERRDAGAKVEVTQVAKIDLDDLWFADEVAAGDTSDGQSG